MKGVNGVNEICVFSTNRAKSFSKLEDLCIKPLSKYFKEALEGDQPGKLQLEHFFVTSHTEDEDKKNIAASIMYWK